VADAGDPDTSPRVDVVREVLQEIGAGEVPEVLVLNKIDLLPDAVEATILAQKLGAKALVSARTGEGLDALTALVRDRAGESREVLDLEIPAADGRTLAYLNRVGKVLSQRYDDDVCHVTASVPRSALGGLERYLPRRAARRRS
jgi:GTP-binding protein HflX